MVDEVSLPEAPAQNLILNKLQEILDELVLQKAILVDIEINTGT